MEEFESLSEKLARITIECDRLRKENCRLRELLNQAGAVDGVFGAEDQRLLSKQPNSAADGPPLTPIEIARTELSVSEKISLFRSLFCGREDVYAVRFELANGKAGYSPACRRDWDALRSLSKSEWKKRDKETRQLLPLTDQVIHEHLSGKVTVGVYPLLIDETCWFLAVDFDQKTWREGALALWIVPRLECSSRPRTLTFRRRRARMGILRVSDRGHVCAATGRSPAHQDHGATPPDWIAFVRPPFPESGARYPNNKRPHRKGNRKTGSR